MSNAITDNNRTSIQKYTLKNLIDCPAEIAVYFLGGKWKIKILKKIELDNIKQLF